MLRRAKGLARRREVFLIFDGVSHCRAPLITLNSDLHSLGKPGKVFGYCPHCDRPMGYRSTRASVSTTLRRRGSTRQPQTSD